MGYCISLEDWKFSIPAKHLDLALVALKDLNKRDDLKTGGRWSGGKQTERWFAWMPADYDKTVRSAAEVFDLLGFEVDGWDHVHKTIDEGADLIITGWNGEKLGAHEHFLDAVADLVTPGSYLEWSGEDDAHWRDEFDGTRRTQKTGRVVYD